MSDAVPSLRPQHDWQRLVLFVLACAGAVYAFGDKILAVGKTTAAIEKIDRMEAAQNQFGVDMARTKIQVEMISGGLQELKVDTHDGLRDINTQLRRDAATGHRRASAE